MVPEDHGDTRLPEEEERARGSQDLNLVLGVKKSLREGHANSKQPWMIANYVFHDGIKINTLLADPGLGVPGLSVLMDLVMLDLDEEGDLDLIALMGMERLLDGLRNKPGEAITQDNFNFLR